jgi:hypothetical protein
MEEREGKEFAGEVEKLGSASDKMPSPTQTPDRPTVIITTLDNDDRVTRT